MEGGGEGSSSSPTHLSGGSTEGTFHDVSSVIRFHDKVIDAVLTATVQTRQRSGIRIAIKADAARELGVQLINFQQVINVECGWEASPTHLSEHLSGESTGGTPHDVSSVIYFHDKVIDAVLTVTVLTRQRSGIRIAVQADAARELGVQQLIGLVRRSSHCVAFCTQTC